MRILVVRAAHQAEATAKALLRAGHVPIVAPILSIVPTDALPPTSRPDALLVTSRNGVPALGRYREMFHGIRIFAVGPRTAEALVGDGWSEVAAAGGDGTDLARLVRAGLSPGARLLHVAGRERRPEPARSLAAAGYAIDIWEAYAAEPVGTLPLSVYEALEAGALDAVLHYSPRSAALLRRLAAEAGVAAPFAALLHLCLSANVAAALAGMPASRVLIAAAPDETHLLALLDARDRAD